MIEQYALSRTLPSDAGTCARRMPSSCAPRGSIAARERAFRRSVLNVMHSTSHVSNA
jgi:hypothetical protein